MTNSNWLPGWVGELNNIMNKEKGVHDQVNGLKNSSAETGYWEKRVIGTKPGWNTKMGLKTKSRNSDTDHCSERVSEFPVAPAAIRVSTTICLNEAQKYHTSVRFHELARLPNNHVHQAKIIHPHKHIQIFNIRG